ncbi:MAG: alanine--glyoxylate aminotransferase family protein [Candidatus Krumholzibacteria bacterium]|nr:alanine--glyoxylate aminotransferase family protein [Candidatus Krumholzibacteria bacterium]
MTQSKKTELLLTPGPVHIQPGAWGSLEPVHHRTERFREIVRESSAMIGVLAGTSRDVFFLTASGSGAMESAICNLTSPGTRVMTVSGGKFGDRWTELALAFGCDVDPVRFEPGKRIDVSIILDRMEKKTPAVITLVQVESSTGLLLELGKLLESLPEPRPLVILDAVASLGSEEIRMDDWGIDLLVSAGQKALAAPPGISLVIASERAAALYRKNDNRKYYFSYRRYEEGMLTMDTPFTPAVQSLQIMHGSLVKMKDDGVEAVRERHAVFAQAFLRAAALLGLECFPEVPSASVQALRMPQGVIADDLLLYLVDKKGLRLTGGQGELKGKMIRTGFLGVHCAGVTRSLVEGLAGGLREQGFDRDLGRALGELAGLKDHVG